MEKKELTTNEYRNEIEFQITNARINAESPYNDGWTQEGYREKVISLEKKLMNFLLNLFNIFYPFGLF